MKQEYSYTIIPVTGRVEYVTVVWDTVRQRDGTKGVRLEFEPVVAWKVICDEKLGDDTINYAEPIMVEPQINAGVGAILFRDTGRWYIQGGDNGWHLEPLFKIMEEDFRSRQT